MGHIKLLYVGRLKMIWVQTMIFVFHLTLFCFGVNYKIKNSQSVFQSHTPKVPIIFQLILHRYH
jgi:hypothetical protein